MSENPTTDELLTAEQAQGRLGVGRSLFWKLVKYHGVPQFVGPVSGHGRTWSRFRPEDVDQLREPVGRVLRSAAEHRLRDRVQKTVFVRPDRAPFPPRRAP